MKKLILLFLFTISLFALSSCDDIFDSTVDVIENYTITVDQRDDGTLDMIYDIDWKVVSNAEGPLYDAYIGIPNKYIDTLINLSDDCRSVAYDNDDGDFIKCTLNKSISKGESANFKFSFHANALYTFDEETLYYEFIPGWFEDIEIKSLSVLWNNKNVIKNNSNKSSNDGYLVWNYRLDKGESIEVLVNYDRSDYPNLILEGDYADYQKEQRNEKILGYIFLGFVLLVIIVIIITAIAYKKSQDGYFSYRGFYRGHRYGWYHRHFRYRYGYNKKGRPVKDPRIVNSSGGFRTGGGGRSCACACACACAGGGRAGCSRKDFYNPKLKINDFKRVIDNEKK